MYGVQAWIARNQDGWEKPEIEVDCRKAARTAWTALASALQPHSGAAIGACYFYFYPIPGRIPISFPRRGQGLQPRERAAQLCARHNGVQLSPMCDEASHKPRTRVCRLISRALLGSWFCLMSAAGDDSMPPESLDQRELFVAQWYSFCDLGTRLAGMSLADHRVSTDKGILHSATLLWPAVWSQL